MPHSPHAPSRLPSGTDWSQGFTALGDLFPFEPDGEPDGGIMNVPDFWKRDETVRARESSASA